MIIDAQIHVWEPSRPDRPWPAGHFPESQRLEALGAEEALAEMARAGVNRAVLVPPSFEGDRNDVALKAALRYPDKFKVMGRFPLAHPNAPEVLAAWKDQPGMAGIRITFLHAHELAWVRDKASEWFWGTAEKLNIALMIFPPNNLPDIIPIAKRHPRLNLIIDHIGVQSSLRDATAIAQMDALLQLAQCPNVSVKMSAVDCMSTAAYPYANLHAALERIFNAFGKHRCFWGSDLSRIKYWQRGTNGRLTSSYPDVVSLFGKHLRFMSPTDVEWVMGRAIAEVLNWQ